MGVSYDSEGIKKKNLPPNLHKSIDQGSLKARHTAVIALLRSYFQYNYISRHENVKKNSWNRKENNSRATMPYKKDPNNLEPEFHIKITQETREYWKI